MNEVDRVQRPTDISVTILAQSQVCRMAGLSSPSFHPSSWDDDSSWNDESLFHDTDEDSEDKLLIQGYTQTQTQMLMQGPEACSCPVEVVRDAVQQGRTQVDENSIKCPLCPQHKAYVFSRTSRDAFRTADGFVPSRLSGKNTLIQQRFSQSCHLNAVHLNFHVT